MKKFVNHVFNVIFCFPIFGRTFGQNGNCSMFGQTPKYNVRSNTNYNHCARDSNLQKIAHCSHPSDELLL